MSDPQQPESPGGLVAPQVLAAAVPGRVVRVFCFDGTAYTLHLQMPFLQWLAQMQQWQGIFFEYAWIPQASIKLIVPVTQVGDVELPPNVVPFKQPGL